jgi:histidine triad (HIT) family protein
MSEPTLFERILAGEIPAQIAYQDDLAFVIHDINPQAPVHVLVIPKKPLTRLGEADSADQALLGHLLLVAAKMARELELAEGYRVVLNNGPHGGESVPHLHVHVLGGRQLTWPPG